MRAEIQIGVEEEEVTLIKAATAKSMSDRGQSLLLLAATDVRVSALAFNSAFWQRFGLGTLILKPYIQYMCTCVGFQDG